MRRRVLFLCTANSSRSILAEAYLNHVAEGRFAAHSAGSHPAGQVNPLALELLEQRGIETAGLRSKNWDEFAQPEAPAINLILNVCDGAAGEACPVWPGRPLTAHWGVADPAAARGSEEEKREAFRRAFLALSRRIDALLALPLDALDSASLKRSLQDIGRSSAA
jgi:arsenate reductase (thioredoxin)